MAARAIKISYGEIIARDKTSLDITWPKINRLLI
jgi:hypothetical protein